MIRRFATPFFACALFITAVVATANPSEATFESLDGNADGFLTRDEVPAGHELSRDFATFDTDGDDRLSAAEFNAYTSTVEEY